MNDVKPSQTDKAEVLGDSVLHGQVIIVTGAGSGIGRATARRLVNLGAQVVGLGRHEETLRATGDGLAEERYGYEVLNVRDREAALATVASIGDDRGLTGLVNCAGGQFIAEAEAISQRGWDSVIDLNLNAVFNLVAAAYPYLKIDGGSVINISLSGVERGSMGMAHSIAARSGVLGLTRTLSLEWASDKIRVNCIGPGTVVTDVLGASYASDIVDDFIAATPLGRGTRAEEVAELIAFMMSPAGEMISGQLLQIDGASSLGRGLHGLSR